MSYLTNCRGQITISPAIPWADLMGSPFLPSNLGGKNLDVVLVMAESTVDMGTGPLIARAAHAVAQRWNSEPRNYHIVEHLQQLIDAFPGHEFSGRFDCEGEEGGDLWRLVVRGRTAVRVDPVITWPDEPFIATAAAEVSGDDQVRFLAAWAARHGAALQLEGECGIGRDCVGIMVGTTYLDYSYLWADQPEQAVTFWKPADAYHKHDCLAVLGRGPDAMGQLYEWVKWLDDDGWTVEVVDRRPTDMFDLLLHGVSTPRLVRRAVSA